jgi:Ca2+-binding EF-hand superfamily protein
MANIGEKFLELKWRKFFKVMDVDHDEKITKEDYVLMGERFASSSLVPEERKAVVEKHFVDIWNTLYNKDGKTTEVTADQLVHLFTEAGKSGLEKICKETCPLVFQAIDADGDGIIQIDEYRNFFRLFNKDVSMADKSFEGIDTNKNGVLSVAEFTEAWRDFMTSLDQKSPYQLLFGHLDA